MDAHNTFATARIGLVAIALTLPLAGCKTASPRPRMTLA